MRHPVVTFKRAAFRTICETAAANMTECVGMLVGRRLDDFRWHIEHNIPIAHCFADANNIHYYYEDVVSARVTAEEMHPPNQGVGLWHSHPWDELSAHAMESATLPQMHKDDEKIVEPDDLQGLVVAFPHYKGFSRKGNEYLLQRRVGSRIVRMEVWHKDIHGRVRACFVKLR